MGVVAEGLVQAVRQAGQAWGMNEVFLGFIVLAIVGNAAEHSTAVMLAMRGQMDTALNISMQSSVQIALFVTPLLVFLSYPLGHPLDLLFTPFEILACVLGVAIFAYLVMDGETNWYEGVQLLAVYAIIAVALYFLPAACNAGSRGRDEAAAVRLRNRSRHQCGVGLLHGARERGRDGAGEHHQRRRHGLSTRCSWGWGSDSSSRRFEDTARTLPAHRYPPALVDRYVPAAGRHGLLSPRPTAGSSSSSPRCIRFSTTQRSSGLDQAICFGISPTIFFLQLFSHPSVSSLHRLRRTRTSSSAACSSRSPSSSRCRNGVRASCS